MYNFLAPLKMSSLVTSTAPARDTEPGSQVSSPEKAMGSRFQLRSAGHQPFTATSDLAGPFSESFLICWKQKTRGLRMPS